MRRIAIATALALLPLAMPAAGHAVTHRAGHAAQAGHAAASGYPDVVYVAGDAHYLLYDRYSSYAHAVLYVRTKHGQPRSLGSEETKARRSLFYSLMGSTLTGGNEESRTVEWWNLAAHTTGTVTMPNIGDSWIGTLPGGFFFADNTKHQPVFYRESVPSGHVTRLPRELTRGIVAGPTGYVGIAGTLSFVPYGGGTPVDLDVPHKYANDEISCDEVWQFYVRCLDYGDDGGGEYDTTLMLPLDGGKAIVITAHWGPVPLKHVLVYGSKHPRFLSASGHITISRTTGRVEGEAFEAAIISNGSLLSSTKLEALPTSSASPVVVAHA
jgi:hypothetical protein